MPRSSLWRVWVLIAISSVFVAARLVAPFALAFDLLANVSYFAAVPLACVAVLAWSRRLWRTGMASAALAAVAAVPVVAPIALGTPITLDGPTAKVLFCNIEGRVSAVESLLLIIEREDPDIVAIVEAEKPVVRALLQCDDLTDRFPFKVAPQIGLEWPHLIMTRHPLEILRLNDKEKRYRRLYTFHCGVEISLPSGRIVFSAEHLPSPRRTASWRDGNDRIETLGSLIGDQLAPLGLPIVIAGDFNATPSGYRHGLLTALTGLRPDRLGVPPVGTWPS